jgi:SNF2 family DNA or RNA helicase
MAAPVQPEAEVSLEGQTVVVRGGGLGLPRHALFFRSVLGATEVEGGWDCPVRNSDGNALVVRIARRLQDLGYQVNAQGGADQALERELERLRSFERVRAAARSLLGLDNNYDGPVIAEVDVVETLRSAGWNFTDRDLRPHQLHGCVHALTAGNAANFSVPGAGKTATSLAIAVTHLAHGTIDAVCVVGPLSCFAPWEREARLAAPGIFSSHRVRGGTRHQRTAFYERVQRGDLLLLSYQTAASDRFQLEFLCRRLRIMLVVDESHRVKRFRGGTWAPALMEISRLARVKLILTGTPMPQGPRDLYSQLNILWPGGELTGPRARFAAQADNNFGSVITAVEPFFVRTPKHQLGLLEARFFEHPVDMPPLQAQIYELIVQRLRNTIPPDVSWQDRIAALRRARPIRLIQAASNPDLLNEVDGFFEIPPLANPSGTLLERLHRYREFGELPAKFRFALDFLTELQAEERKCVVWTSFVRNIDQLGRLIEDQLHATVYTVDGRVPAADVDLETAGEEEIDEYREQRIDRFLAEEGFAVLIANPAACAESISLHSHCHTALYVDRTHDCARWLQSIDRIHRLGLPEDVQVEVHVPKARLDGAPAIDDLIDRRLAIKEANMRSLLEGAELRAAGIANEDTLDAAEGSEEDLTAILEYLLGIQ